MITAEQCFTFGMVGAIGFLFSIIITPISQNISATSSFIGVLLIVTSGVGSIYVLFKGQSDLNKNRV